MKTFFCLMLAVLLGVTMASEAEARGRWFGRQSGSSVSASMTYVATAESTDKLYVGGTMSLMDVAQSRADAMARRGMMTHGIHTYERVVSYSAVGVAEGIGYGGGPDPKRIATCICGSRVVADAWARATSGAIYRVRFFRP